MKIDYDEASQSYDNTRSADDRLIDHFARRVTLNAATTVLDFGCGTGNYLVQLHKRFGCRCYGVEPSAGMRAIAQAKAPSLEIKEGNHASIPYPDGFFDFIYMTDVVHHVPDLGVMFGELRRVLKAGGRLCIVTESHAQIAARFYNRYFPSLCANEQARYPRVETLIEEGEAAGFSRNHLAELPHQEGREVTDEFITNVAEKNYSMFRLLTASEFEDGLAQLHSVKGIVFAPTGSGASLIWLSLLIGRV